MIRPLILVIARAGRLVVRRVVYWLMLVLCWPDPSQARLRLDDPDVAAAVCEHAAMQVAAESGVPADILAGLTLTETGRRRNGVVRPWAWSANADGAGSWFDDPASALAYVEDRIAMGRPSVDVGCFQLNYRWHGENFPSVAAMLDPMTNARYAARFVRQLYQETGDWRAAAGAFHSRTPVHANRYLKRFDELRAMYQSRGFQGMTGSPETYNQFADAAPMPVEKVRRAREKLTLLGAPIGTPLTGRAGSLAVIGDSRGALLVAGGSGPLFGQGGMLDRGELP
ncbi:MAG: hypothetical protein Q4G22_11585 [Paracoccus sp. (in: a-proteobacteria)]|uniref:hypothetical protein n=1 Tax=Paracoccus sp. TaxID=267 RepID=UPI0026DF356C|nr:hypothetical protein [Paracoccus sp. (in: a-proteobacteria)]MDO5632463.1 hypothetical protein [Paracoccus sp. (in: a-proteobacteria)]